MHIVYSNDSSSPVSVTAKKTEEGVDDIFKSPSLKSFVDEAAPDSFPLPKDVPSIPHQPDVKKQYDLEAIENISTLNLLDDTKKGQLNQKLMKAYELIKKSTDYLSPLCPDMADTLESEINLLGLFDSDTQKYEEMAIQLHKHLNTNYSVSRYLFRKEEIELVDSWLNQAHKENLSLVFIALCQKHFNEGNFSQCAPLIEEVARYHPDVKETIAFALSHHYIHQLKFDEALAQLDTCSHTSKKDALFLHIAKMLFNSEKYEEALKAVKKMSPYRLDTKESDAFILNIGKVYLEKNELDQAYKVAEGLSAIDADRDEFVFDIANAYVKQAHPDLEAALKVAQDLIYSSEQKNKITVEVIKKYLGKGDLEKALHVTKHPLYGLYGLERDEWIFTIAKAYFNQSNWDKAAKLARDMSYSKERDEFMMAIIKKYLSKDELETALKMAKDLPYSSERNALILHIAQIHQTQKKDLETALKIAKDLMDSKQKTAFILNLAQVYMAEKNDSETALKIAKDLTCGKERDAFILNIVRTYYRAGQRSLAIKIAEDASIFRHSTLNFDERDLLLQQMRKGATI